jgi:hypothetical protein
MPFPVPAQIATPEFVWVFPSFFCTGILPKVNYLYQLELSRLAFLLLPPSPFAAEFRSLPIARYENWVRTLQNTWMALSPNKRLVKSFFASPAFFR